MRRSLPSLLLALGTLGAIALGASLVRAGLVTDYVGVQPDYLLTGPADPTCDVPGNVERQVAVSWTDRDDAEAGFIVTRQGPLVSGTSTASFQLPAHAGNRGTVTFTDTSVVPDASYTYTVRSFLGPALSPATSTSDGCSTQSVPAQPSEVEAVGIGQHGIRISWATNSANHEGFKVYRYSSADSRSGVESVLLVAADATSYQDYGAELAAPGLLSRTEYCYYVMAYNSRGPSAPPNGASLACADTWSVQPVVSNVEVGEGAAPTFTWQFADADPPGGGAAQQSAVQVQVCAAAFIDDGDGDYGNDCGGDNWRWDSGQQAYTGQSVGFLHGYPWEGAAQQHPLDYGDSAQYYVRIRAWDDTATPSEWATPAVPYFTLRPPSGAIVNTLEGAEGLTLTGGAAQSSGYGGEVTLPGGSAAVGALPSLVNVVSVRLLGSAVPEVVWQVRRPGDSAWETVGGDGTSPAVWPSPANGLEWKASMPGGGASAILGGVALAVNANHAPTVAQCRAVRLIGGVGDSFAFTVSISDPDPDFDYDLTQVRFDWDGGTGSANWQSFGSGGPLTEFSSGWASEGSFTPTVQARDQYGATSATVACDTVLVGSATPAWLRAQDADVFSGGTIYGRSPAGQANATYLVQASGEIQEFSTQALNCQRSADTPCTVEDVRTPGYRQIPLPQPDESASLPLGTILGSVDLPGILSGRYSNGSVVELSGSNTNLGGFFNGLPASPLAPSAKVLNGAIVHVLGNATVDATTTIGNAGEGQSGAGLIVVDGDLFINAPISYDVNPVQVSLKRLASLGWLVRGNVYVSSWVWAVDGANPAAACPGVGSYATCRPGVVGTFYLYDRGTSGTRGVFFTGSDGSQADLPLQLGGLVVAQRFALQRNLVDENVPAELFRYDGRVFANPPPGLQDFAKALPRWKPLAPLP